MATIVIDQKTTNQNYYYIKQEGNLLKVGACVLICDNICSYPFASYTYNVKDLAKAKATFRRYIKKYN